MAGSQGPSSLDFSFGVAGPSSLPFYRPYNPDTHLGFDALMPHVASTDSLAPQCFDMLRRTDAFSTSPVPAYLSSSLPSFYRFTSAGTPSYSWPRVFPALAWRPPLIQTARKRKAEGIDSVRPQKKPKAGEVFAPALTSVSQA